MAFDAQRYAMDYHVIGFQECVSEVARYLATHEGMDVQNPLRTRLLSHLRCFAAQRELSVKSATATPAPTQNWTPSTPATYSQLPQTGGYSSTSSLPPPTLTTPATTPTSSTLLSSRSIPSISSASPVSSSAPSTTVASTSSSSAMYSSTSSNTTGTIAGYSSLATSAPHMPNYPYVPNLVPTSDIFTDITATAGSSIPPHDLAAQNHYIQHHDQNGSTYTDLTATAQRNAALVSIGYSNQYATANSMPSYGVNGTEIDPLSAAYNSNKPYRPWGGEMAY